MTHVQGQNHAPGEGVRDRRLISFVIYGPARAVREISNESALVEDPEQRSFRGASRQVSMLWAVGGKPKLSTSGFRTGAFAKKARRTPTSWAA